MAKSSSKPGVAPNGNVLRKSKAREAMIVAADELFSELGGYDGGGYEATTVDLIVERAGVSRRTFFNHFTGKADVLMLDFRTMSENHLNAFRNRPESEAPLQAALLAMEDMNQNFFASHVNRRRYVRQLRLGMKASQWSLMGEWEMRIAEEISNRLTGRDKSTRARIMAGQAALMIRIASEQWFAGGLLKGESIVASLRKVERMANKVAEEAYPLINK